MSSPSFRVANWDEYQHYRDRNPPWIKLHFALLSGETWVSLDDASRVLAVACMLLASRNGGRVPANPAYVKRVAYLNTLPDFKPLILSGFLLDDSGLLADASGLLADASKLLDQRRGETETETEESTVQPQAVAPPAPWVSFAEFWSIWIHNRKGKADAEKAWNVLKPGRELFETIKRDLSDRMDRDPTWQKGMVMLPATYIRGKRWNDELQGSTPQQQSLLSTRHLRVWELPVPEHRRWECEGRLEMGQVYRDGLWVKFEDLDPEDPDYRPGGASA